MPEGEGVQEAFCLLLWVNNGGRLDSKGRPAFHMSGPTTGTCTRPYDCTSCALMQEEIGKLDPGLAAWICPACIVAVIAKAKAESKPFNLPGHYSEGYCQYKYCEREELRIGEAVIPARYSPLLQLFICELNQEG